MAAKFNCSTSPEDTVEVQEYHGIIRLSAAARCRAVVIHLSAKDAKALRKELKKIIKEIESNA